MRGIKKTLYIISLWSLALSACAHKPASQVSQTAVEQESKGEPASEGDPVAVETSSEEIKIFSDLPREGEEMPGEGEGTAVPASGEGEGAAVPASGEEEGEEAMFQALAGSWKLDGARTQAGLTEHGSLQEMFGTGLSHGAGLEISGTGEMSYYIGIGIGGRGQCQVSGDVAAVSVTPYQDLGDYDTEFKLWLVTEGENTYLVMDSVAGEHLYWSK